MHAHRIRAYCWLPLTAALVAPVAAQERPPLLPPYDETSCWVDIFDGKDYQPPKARLTGPNFLESPETGPVVSLDLREVGGQAFIARVDSLVVGPRARITLFAEPTYSGDRVGFKAGEKVPDLARHGFANRISSIRMECD